MCSERAQPTGAMNAGEESSLGQRGPLTCAAVLGADALALVLSHAALLPDLGLPSLDRGRVHTVGTDPATPSAVWAMPFGVQAEVVSPARAAAAGACARLRLVALGGLVGDAVRGLRTPR